LRLDTSAIQPQKAADSVEARLLASKNAPSSLLSGTWRLVYSLNPMAGAIEWTRWSLFNAGPAPEKVFFASIPVVLLLLASGAYVFRRMENTFADVV